MTKQELSDRISELLKAADKLDEPERTFKLVDVSRLKIAIHGMSVSDIAGKMQSISLPEIQELEDSIQLATQAVSSHSARVKAFNKAYGIIKGAIGLAI